MPVQYQPVVANPTQGGDLITQYSTDDVGASNYTVKRDFRRVQDGESRREGDALFWGNPSVSQGNQPYPEGAPGNALTLVHHSRKANGKSAIIVGTQTTLYRFFSYEDGEVYTSDVYEVGVYADLSGNWLTIVDNQSTNGNRWEAVDVAGVTIFNNGYDLPLVYDLGWLSARPMYELREQGVANVGTISEFNGMLFCADVSNMTQDLINETFNGVNSGGTTASQSGFNVTASAPFFTTAMIGQTLTFDTGNAVRILSVGSSTLANVNISQTVASAAFNVAVLFGDVTDATRISRVRYQLLNSDVGFPQAYGAVFNGEGVAGSQVITLDLPAYSIKIGDSIVCTAIGTSSSALTVNVLGIDTAYHRYLIIDQPAVLSANTTVQQASYPSASIGSQDLQDDGSAVIRLIELQGRLIVFKQTSIFIGIFTGVNTAPMQYQRLYYGPDCLFWKWMITKIDGTSIIYATQKDFFTFDLSVLLPRKHDKLRLSSNVFYDGVASVNAMDQCYASTNELTREAWFVFPVSTKFPNDYGLCYDYEYQTVSTIGTAYNACATVDTPSAGVVSESPRIFVAGTVNGVLLTYGFDSFAGNLYQRQGNQYLSTLRGGTIDFGDQFNEKDVNAYVIYLSNHRLGGTVPAINLTFRGARNASEIPSTLFTQLILHPDTQNLVPMFYRKNLFQDQVDAPINPVTGTNYNLVVTRRLFNPARVDSKSTIRNVST